MRISRTFDQLKSQGLLPAQDDDGIDEMSWIDIVQTPGQSYSDSEAFSALGYAFRGKATLDASKSLESIPPCSAPSVSYMKSAGCEVMTATYGAVQSDKRLVKRSYPKENCST